MSHAEFKSPTGPLASPSAKRERTVATVLVPILNERRYIADTIARMGRQRLDGILEFLLIDGCSTDGTRELIEELTVGDPRFRLLSNPRRATPDALNLGLREARGRYVVRMDAHTRYPDDYIARGIARLQQGDVAWVSGPQVPYGVGPWSRRIALALDTWLGRGGAKFRVVFPDEIDVDTGYCGVWRRETLLRYGGWDEGWPINQDSEMAARFRAAGDRIVCVPEMEADYIPRDSLKAFARQYWRYGVYRAKTSKRHRHSMRRSHVLAPVLALTVTVAAGSPRPLRRSARAAVVVYLLTSLGFSADVARREPLRDAMCLPAVFVTMHIAWGFGFLAGCARFGVPFPALASLAQPRPSGPGRSGPSG